MSCECVHCDYCGGTGHIWMDGCGHISRFRCDDLGDLEECPDCDGRGIIEKCMECCDAEYEEL